jgi:hypothetical protein
MREKIRGKAIKVNTERCNGLLNFAKFDVEQNMISSNLLDP